MIFTPDRSVMYVSVPKTGCTTIKMIVAASVGMVSRESLEHETSGRIHNMWRSRSSRWSNVLDARREALLTAESTFRFTSVRNPFERLVSCYLNKVADDRGNANLGRRMREMGDTSLISFLEFVAIQPPLMRDVHCRAMSDLCYAGRVQYDDVVRYETFEHDLRRVMGKMNVADFEIPTPPAAARTRAGAQMHALLGSKECDLIREIYRRDFEAFGYSMELPPA